MKEFIRPKQVNITEESKYYRTNDGKIFYKKHEAESHEAYLNSEETINKLKCIVLDIDEFDRWFYVASETDLAAIMIYYKPSETYGDLKIGEWFYPKYFGETDYQDGFCDIFTLEYIKSQLNMVK
jgi:hypothetical protein